MPWSPISNGPSIEAKFKFTPSGAKQMTDHAVIESEPVKPKTVDRFVLMVHVRGRGWHAGEAFDSPEQCERDWAEYHATCRWTDHRIIAVRGLPVGE